MKTLTRYVVWQPDHNMDNTYINASMYPTLSHAKAAIRTLENYWPEHKGTYQIGVVKFETKAS